MSENLDLVRSIVAAHERGDYSSADWADPDIEYVIADGPEPVACRGRAAMAKAWRDVLSAYTDHRMVVEDIREIDEERIIVLASFGGTGKASGLDAFAGTKPGVTLYQVRHGRVIRHVVYWEVDHALADLGLEALVVSEESTTPDLVERARLAIDAIGARDLDAAMSFFAPHAVLEAVVGRFDGLAAIRGFLDEWLASYEEFDAVAEEVVAIGNRVTFGVFRQRGRVVGSSGQVQLRFALAAEWADGAMVRAITNPDIDAGRAAAERLAEERG